MSRRATFDGRVAVVTGAASGIGAALAQALAARGCHLALADVDRAGLAAIAERVRRPDRRLTTAVLDVADRAGVSAFAEAVRGEHGGAHLLFNNAGVGVGGPFERVSVEDFDWLFAVNFGGVVNMTRAFLGQLRQSGEGRLVNVSSILGVIATPGAVPYCASKFAVRGFSDALRHELGETGVRVTTVHPGGVSTNIAKRARLPKDAAPEDVAAGQREAARNLRMPPARAAEIILRGVERGAPRILVGHDAHAIALIERLFPTSYWAILGGRVRRQAKRSHAKTK